MALKQLLLRKKLDELLSRQEKADEELRGLKEEEKTLEEAIEEIDEETTDEDRAVVEEEVEKLVAQLEEKQNAKDELDAEIEGIKAQIAELETENEEEESQEEEVEETKEAERSVESKKFKMRGGYNMDLQTRERINYMLQNEENRSFFKNVRDIFEKRFTTPALTNGELLIPEEIFVEVARRAENYGTLMNLVDVIKLKGQARIVILDGAVTFQWLECCEPTQETTLGDVKQIELDCFKYGGHVFVCDAFVEDAAINFADFVMNLFAEGWAKGIDEAIYAGAGTTAKEPEGITMSVTEVEPVADLRELLIAMGGVEQGKGEQVIVMSKKTYSSKVLPETLGTDSNGRIVYGLGQSLPDGTRVVIADVIPQGEAVIGYFKEYKLGVRKEMTFDTNDRVKWVEGQIGYKVWGRVDGKITDAKYFKRVNFEEAEAEPVPGA